MTRRANLNETNRSIRKDSIASGGAVTGANSTMMMDTGVDLLSRVQMFQIAVNKINQRGGAELKKEQVFKLGINARETANKYFDSTK